MIWPRSSAPLPSTWLVEGRAFKLVPANVTKAPASQLLATIVVVFRLFSMI